MKAAEAIWQSLSAVRAEAPLVHNITNFVVMNTTANALLAVGASPVMVHAAEEVEQMTAMARALVVNLGTLSPPWATAMRLAVARAGTAGTPWVLDPVGVGALAWRTGIAAELIRQQPAAVRGNGSEILALAGAAGAAGKGVDSRHDSAAAVDIARGLARATGAVVAITGRVDYVTDGERQVAIANGHPLMARVTGLGCTATALVGAFCAVEADRLAATAHALAVLGMAGEIAAERAAGPGSLQVGLLDALYTLDLDTIRQRERMQ